MKRSLLFVCCVCSVFLVPFLHAAEKNHAPAVRRAVEAVSARLVRIDTIGGREKVGSEFANEGTATGFLLDRDGFVLTGAFHFLHDPTSILLRFADGTKKVASRVATDYNRMLTLLKVEDLDLNHLPDSFEFRSRESVLPGERCLVVGVALALEEPNVALGIVSGVGRIWGKAIQTDAAIGPNNYGGPVVDFAGMPIAMAVPLSMMSDELTAGSEMYDAGVGMAVPFEDIVRIVLPKLKEGKNLHAGTLGIHFKENRTFIGAAILDGVEPGLPAEKAGMKAGDRIVSIDGKVIENALEVAMNLRPRYAGETMELVFMRNGEEKRVSLTTVVSPQKEKPR